ncbi:MAG: hypothetical protein JWR44_2457, partial [Hymenobacter sp.]|nr:hypothetical protein [Hymenobacter sp.]
FKRRVFSRMHPRTGRFTGDLSRKNRGKPSAESIPEA